MPFREPPNLDRVDTSFVSKAGTPASEMLRNEAGSESTPLAEPETPAPRKSSGKSSPRKAGSGKSPARNKGSKEDRATVTPPAARSARRSAASADAGAADAGGVGEETAPRARVDAVEADAEPKRKPRSRSRSSRSARSTGASSAEASASESSQFVEPDARMLVNVRMPVALHERLKAASEHTSLTITDIVIRGTESELESVEQRYIEIMGEPIPVQRRKVRID